MHKFYTQKQYRRKGVSTIEYGILAALIAVASIGSLTLLGNNNSTLYCKIDKAIAKSSQKNPQINLLDTANDSCLNQSWYTSIGINPNNVTPQNIAIACQNHGADGCFAHYEQMNFAGNRAAYIESMGGNADQLIQEDDDQATKATKSNNAGQIANELCQTQYPNNTLLSGYCATSVSDVINMYDPSTDAWDPTISNN